MTRRPLRASDILCEERFATCDREDGNRMAEILLKIMQAEDWIMESAERAVGEELSRLAEEETRESKQVSRKEIGKVSKRMVEKN